MKVIHGSLPQDNDPANFKTCPICGSVCFADMDTCFGCLHHFTDADATKTTPIPIVRNNERVIAPAGIEEQRTSDRVSRGWERQW